MYELRMPVSFKKFAKEGRTFEECMQYAKIDDGTYRVVTKEEWLAYMKNHYTEALAEVKEMLELLNRF